MIVEHVLPDLDPTLLVFWHTDPDKTQHHRGFGSPDGMASIRDADTHLGQVLAALDAQGELTETVIAVASDHGYVTIDPLVTPDGPDGPFLAAGLGDALADGEIVLAPNGGSLYISVPSGDRALLERIVAALAAWKHGGPVLVEGGGRRAAAGHAAAGGGRDRRRPRARHHLRAGLGRRHEPVRAGRALGRLRSRHHGRATAGSAPGRSTTRWC